MLLLACAEEPLPARDAAPSALRRGPAVEICDERDNDGDGVTDEDCSGCERFVTRPASFWAEHACVMDDDSSGSPLFRAALGVGDVRGSREIAASLGATPGTPRARLLQQLTTARLNVAAFTLEEQPWADLDGDGEAETVSALLAAAEAALGSSTPREQGLWADELTALNDAGSALEAWFDEDCAAAPEICNDLDDDGDGELDESCACFEVCDGVDNDQDGEADETCVVPCAREEPASFGLGEAIGRGALKVVSASKSEVVLMNLGTVPVVIDEQVLFTSIATQSFVPDVAVLGQVIEGGSSLSLYYGSWTTDNGKYSPHLGEFAWWCVEAGQPHAATALFELYGEVAPDALLAWLNEENDADGDGVEDHVDWAGSYGVQSNYSVWETQAGQALFTVGKSAVLDGDGIVVSLLVRNYGAVAGTATLRDPVPAGWTVEEADPDTIFGADELSWELSLEGYDDSGDSVLLDARALSYRIVRDSLADAPEVDLGVASVSSGSTSASSLQTWVFDYDPNQDGIVECDE